MSFCEKFANLIEMGLLVCVGLKLIYFFQIVTIKFSVRMKKATISEINFFPVNFHYFWQLTERNGLGGAVNFFLTINYYLCSKET